MVGTWGINLLAGILFNSSESVYFSNVPSLWCEMTHVPRPLPSGRGSRTKASTDCIERGVQCLGYSLPNLWAPDWKFWLNACRVWESESKALSNFSPKSYAFWDIPSRDHGLYFLWGDPGCIRDCQSRGHWLIRLFSHNPKHTMMLPTLKMTLGKHVTMWRSSEINELSVQVECILLQMELAMTIFQVGLKKIILWNY